MQRILTAFALLSVTTALSAQTPLTVGRPVRDTLARADTARYRVDADSGSLIRLAVDQISVNKYPGPGTGAEGEYAS